MDHTTRKLAGGCHCGAVRYEVELDASRGTMCNCSICQKIGAVGARVQPEAFRLLSGREALSAYESRSGQRYFCSRCGIHCFGRAEVKELGGAFVSVNLNTLDEVDPLDVQVTHWDGRHDNWRAGTRPERWPRVAAPE
jgi:hypothetical protein